MKKIICILFSFAVLLASTFADKSQFYKNGEVYNIMYVNSEDGLRVRDNPSLRSNRICGLTHCSPVKIISIGKEETIDGITAPWVEILLPFSEWNGMEPEYGWVFGGYLSKDFPEENDNINTLRGIEKTLIYNLWKIQVYYDEFALLKFYADGSAKILKYGEEICSFKYKVLDKQTIQINIPSRVVISEWPIVKDEDGAIVKDAHLDKKSVHSGTFKFSFRKDSDKQIVFTVDNCALHGFKTNYDFAFYQELGERYREIRNKFIPISTDYDSESYWSYWDPIMKEHQKKADAMR